ncbi:hypothetical protein [Oceanobacillus damuensis]|uniref:hypothetical protein n=1 Tax=Oceanobacillus damuensis TaxID=937928 RepID=UPI0008319698|nr:hypothetical protein [Oceanobacillus damuensis]
MDFSTLPSSVATKEITEFPTEDDKYYVTYTAKIDEQKLYNELSNRLGTLELSLNINIKELNDIEILVNDIHISIDLKDELLFRINWVNKLYLAKEKIAFIDSMDKAKEVNRLITPVQICPLKTSIMKELDTFVKSLSDEYTAPEMSPEQNLMAKSIEEAGNEFINLGKTGREYVVAEVIDKYHNGATVEAVKEKTTALEDSIKELTDRKDKKVLLETLKKIPLVNFATIPTERIDIILDQLIQSEPWNGLASLDRLIKQLDRNITHQERVKAEQKIKSLRDGKMDTIDYELARNLSVECKTL